MKKLFIILLSAIMFIGCGAVSDNESEQTTAETIAETNENTETEETYPPDDEPDTVQTESIPETEPEPEPETVQTIQNHPETIPAEPETTPETAETTPAAPETAPTIQETEKSAPIVVQEEKETTTVYVLNTNTKKIHYQWCSSVKDIAEKNYGTTTEYAQAVADGYVPCKKCKP